MTCFLLRGMSGLLRCCLLDQSTPILHHTETNCPHSFSITVLQLPLCFESPVLSYTISSKVGHQSVPFSFQDLINVAKQLASERECSPTETLPVCIQLLRHALYRRVFALACSAADNLLMFANVKVDFVFHYVKIFCAKRKKRKS